MVFLLLTGFFVTGGLLAISSQVEFFSTVKSVEEISSEVAHLTVPLTPSFDILVRVNGQTEIFDGDTPISVSQLLDLIGEETVLKISGLLTGGTILARQVEITESDSEVTVRGRITGLDPDTREIAVRGFVFHVPEEATIVDKDGVPLSFEELKENLFVEVEGNVTEEGLVATTLRVRTRAGDEEGEDDEEEVARINIEGILIEKSDEDLWTVLIEGDQPALVQVTPETDIRVDPEIGDLIKVIGHFNDDLTLTARRIIVKRLLQLAPDKLKMKPDQTRRVEVILRETLGEDVTLSVMSMDESIATVSPDAVTIPAGKATGFFEVTSGAADGETTVVVAMPGELGGRTATVDVSVEDRGHDPEDLKIHWTPGTLNAGTEEETSARLQLNHPAPEDLEVVLMVLEGAGLVTIPATVLIEAGSRVAVVEVTTGPEPGEGLILATLPESVGGGNDDLRVKIREPRGKPGGDDPEEEED